MTYDSSKPINNNADAWKHYIYGDGSDKELSERVKNEIKNHPNVKDQINKLINGKDTDEPRIDLDFEKELDRIGT